MRIFIIDDDDLLLSTLQNELEDVYAVDTAKTVSDALSMARRNNYNAMVIDIGLPDGSGIELTERLRSEGYKIPILILTGNEEIESKVRALDSGADDYLTKPFRIEELQARLRALLRRPVQRIHKSIKVGKLELSYSTRSATYGDRTVPLRRKEFEILELLMLEAGSAVPRMTILENVWDDSSTTLSNVVDVHIKHLRDKIDRPFGKSIIKTVSGIGYKLDPNPY
jgi:two-component system OmpR family response regulator